LRHLGGDKPRYSCATGDFTLWANIAGRTLSEREASTLIRTGSLAPVSGFTSAAKKKFAAGLRLDPTGKVSFFFEDK
jgi:DNA topoisomerase-3